MRSAAVLLLAGAAHAAVAGAPEPGPGGTFPAAAAATGNDLFGSGVGNGDDFRTATIGGHLAWGRLITAIDAAMLTDRAANRRSDELVAVLGLRAAPAAPRTGWHAAAFAGAGVRADGDLGGQAAQNRVHDAIGAARVHLARDPRRVRGVATASAAAGWLGEAPVLTGWWGVQAVAAGQWAPDGEAIAEVGPRLVVLGREGAFWSGVRHRSRAGDPATATAGATGAHEDGWWIDSGTFIAPLGDGGSGWGYELRSGLNLETRAVHGSVGLVFSPGAAAAGPTLDLEHDLGLYAGGAFGVQLRWYPWPWQDSHRSGPVLDWRFGTNPEGSLRFDEAAGAELRHDMWTAGWEEGWRSPSWSGWRFVPWAQAGIGARREAALLQGSGARTSVGETLAPALRGAAGVRVAWREVLSFGLGADGWLPAWSSSVDLPGRRVRLNEPDWALGAHVALHVAW